MCGLDRNAFAWGGENICQWKYCVYQANILKVKTNERYFSSLKTSAVIKISSSWSWRFDAARDPAKDACGENSLKTPSNNKWHIGILQKIYLKRAYKNLWGALGSFEKPRIWPGVHSRKHRHQGGLLWQPSSKPLSLFNHLPTITSCSSTLMPVPLNVFSISMSTEGTELSLNTFERRH